MTGQSQSDMSQILIQNLLTKAQLTHTESSRSPQNTTAQKHIASSFVTAGAIVGNNDAS